MRAVLDGVASAPPADMPLSRFVAESGLRSVVVGMSKDPNAKIMLLLVDPRTRTPLLAVKAPTTDAAAAAVEAERAALTALAETAAPELRATVPRVVGTVEHDGRTALVTSALAGTPMTTSYASRGHTRSVSRVTADFDGARAWLDALQAGGPAAGDAPPRDTADRLRARFPEREHAAAVERAAEIEETLHEHVTAASFVHGDFWFGNVLVGGDGVCGVVDWEAADVRGDPTRDAARFAHVYALYLDRQTRPGHAVRGHAGLRADGWGAGIEFALDGTGWFPGLYRRSLETALERAGAPPRLWRTLALAAVAEMAARTDHAEFARLHIGLFARLACRSSERS